MTFKRYFNKENKVFQVRIRDNPEGYPGFPAGPLFPCHIFLKTPNGLQYMAEGNEGKEWLVDNQSEMIVVTPERTFHLSRREVSHIDGPFEYDSEQCISITEAVKLTGIDRVKIKSKLKLDDGDRVSLIDLQQRFGALSIIPKEQRVTSMIRNLYSQRTVYGGVQFNTYAKDQPYIIERLNKRLQQLIEEIRQSNNLEKESR